MPRPTKPGTRSVSPVSVELYAVEKARDEWHRKFTEAHQRMEEAEEKWRNTFDTLRAERVAHADKIAAIEARYRKLLDEAEERVAEARMEKALIRSTLLAAVAAASRGV